MDIDLNKLRGTEFTLQTDYGPDSAREIWAKDRLAELQQRYQEEAQQYLDILAEEHSLKTPKLFIVPA